jgi:hypothetical protein
MTEFECSEMHASCMTIDDGKLCSWCGNPQLTYTTIQSAAVIVVTMSQSSDNITASSQQSNVEILVPRHVSSVPPINASTRFLQVHRSAGVAWRGLFPLLIDSPPHICQRLLSLLFLSSQGSMTGSSSYHILDLEQSNEKDENGTEENDRLRGFFHRTIRLQNAPKVTLILQPPIIPQLDSTFTRVVLKTEQSMLRLQTMTAWLSTLGGGYFFCKRLNVSLQLARQQRFLALKIGNISMARQCSVNEAYNLIYAGRFEEGKRILTQLENSIRSAVKTGEQEEEGSVTLRQCEAARLLAKRLKKVAKRGLKGYHTFEKGEKHTIDDYQRIRIVQD